MILLAWFGFLAALVVLLLVLLTIRRPAVMVGLWVAAAILIPNYLTGGFTV